MLGVGPPPQPGRSSEDAIRIALRTIALVTALSVTGWVVSEPAFDGPHAWSSSLRPDVALFALWAPLAFWWVQKLPMRKALYVYLTVSLFVEPFSEIMLRLRGDGYWDSILWPAAVAYYGTIKEWCGLPGASFSWFLVVTVALVVRARRTRPRAESDSVALGQRILALFGAALVSLAVWGCLRGAPIENVFRQSIHMAQLPAIALLFLYAIRIPDDLFALGTLLVTTAIARGVLVVFVYVIVCIPQGITDRPGLPEWCTNHSDTVLFVSAVIVVVTYALHTRARVDVRRALWVTAWLVLAMVLNNRRLAFVSLAAAPLVIFMALSPSRQKRMLSIGLAALVPLSLLYVGVAGDSASTSPLVRPAKIVMSLMQQSDTSSLSRDIENENLIFTMAQNSLIPTGLGFEYQHSPNNPPVDLTELFANYRLIAHNGVLWLWSWGGLIGFFAVWLIFPVACVFALRGYRMAQSAVAKTAALSALGMVIVCVIQVWGDQGLNGYMVPLIWSLAYAVAAKGATLPEPV